MCVNIASYAIQIFLSATKPSFVIMPILCCSNSCRSFEICFIFLCLRIAKTNGPCRAHYFHLSSLIHSICHRFAHLSSFRPIYCEVISVISLHLFECFMNCFLRRQFISFLLFIKQIYVNYEWFPNYNKKCQQRIERLWFRSRLLILSLMNPPFD